MQDDSTGGDAIESISTHDPGPRTHFRRSRSALPFMNLLNGRSGKRIVRQRCMSHEDGWRYAEKMTTATRRIDRRSKDRKYY
jgi:hypothetical protein